MFNSLHQICYHHLCKKVQWWKEAEKAEAGIDAGDEVYFLAVYALHGAVVGAVQRQVQEEDGQQVVGGARRPWDPEEEA